MIYALLGMLSDTIKSDMLRPDYEKTAQVPTLDAIHFLYFDKNNLDRIGFFQLNQLGGIRSLLLKLGALNKIALERQITLSSQNENVSTILRRLSSERENVSTILRRLDFELTGEIIMAATEHDTDREIMKLFRQQRLHSIEISEELLNDASQYLSRGKRLIELSLQYQGDELKGRGAVLKLLLMPTEYMSSFGEGDTRRTQISYAAEKGHVALVKLLLATGADFNAKDMLHWTPLIQAARNGHEAVAKLLVDQGADLEAKWSGWTPLLWAAGEGHEDVVKLLLDRGADLEAKDELGLAPLSHAAENGQTVIVKLLLDCGARFKPNNWAWTRLKGAARNHEDIKIILLNRGAEI